MKYILSISFLVLTACNNAGKSGEDQSPSASAQPIGCSGARTTDKAWYTSGKKAPRFEHLGGIDFKISTNNPEAQAYFNQGMMLAYGFNHAEAARSFYEAARLDSGCAMAYWGYAYVLGPNYNAGMEEDNFQRAYEAVAKAKKYRDRCSPKETALVDALSLRYAAEPPADRGPLDIAYANAMKKVHLQFPDDADVGALYAESLMDLHPWDLYDKTTKIPRAWTGELLATLEKMIRLHPLHPGAHHFFIHAVEASATPEKALPSAAVLDSLVGGAGHLLHMPSHIYINTGDYHLGSLSNIRAISADSTYTTACHAQGAYPLGYYPHNYHFLAATATLEGNAGLAWDAAKKLQAHTDQDIMRLPGWGTLQHYYTIPYYIAVKFSMWDSLLAMQAPAEDIAYLQAIWQYARGMAYLGKHELSRARETYRQLDLLAADSTLQQISIWDINTTADLVQIAARVLEAGIAVQENQLNRADSLLQHAVALEDKLNYNEPPDWFFSVRHHLGAVLLKKGNFAAAEQIYRQDLKTWRQNGWALIGLYHSLAGQNKNTEAQQVKSAFDKSWQYADFALQTSSTITN